MRDIERELTEQELDDALAVLHADVTTGEAGAARARVALLTAIEAPSGRTRRPADATRAGRAPWLATAAVVAMLVGGGLVVPSWFAGPRVVTPTAAEMLDRSALAISGTGDLPVGPGQYRVVQTHAWEGIGLRDEKGVSHEWSAESRTTTWLPADPDDEWQETRTTTGNVRWITEEQPGIAARLGYGEPETEVLRAPRGQFFGPVNPDTGAVNPDHVAGLPRDPADLYEQLRAHPWDESPAEAALVRAAELLSTGLLPADMRATLYQALARVPDIRITDETADLDGRSGMAFGTSDELGFVREIIIDPATGQFIGERVTNPDGVELSSSAVTVIGVADELGGEPAG